MPATPIAALCLAITPWTPGSADVLHATATLLVCMSQQFHTWAHMKQSELPAAVYALQARSPLYVTRNMDAFQAVYAIGSVPVKWRGRFWQRPCCWCG